MTNATYHFVNGTTSTQDYGPHNASVVDRKNPIGCGVFVRAVPPVPAQCGPTCNGVGHPINPASGAVYDTLIDMQSAEALSFQRFFNSTDSGNGDLINGWRHGFSRTVAPKYATMKFMTYAQSPDNSSLYADEVSACASGFREIKTRISAWQNAKASYANGVCTLTVAGVFIGTIDLLYSQPSTLTPGMTLIGFDTIRDDGQLISFSLREGIPVAPPNINLRLQQTASGFTVTDANDNVERYGTNGKLLSITSRAGVVQTMSYDGSGRLSVVSDNFGHQLTLGYDAQNHLISVTRQ